MREVYTKGITNWDLFYSNHLRSLYNKKKFNGKLYRNNSLGNYQIKQNSSLQELIVKLHEMGFNNDRIERAFLYADVTSIEEIMSYLVPNSNGFWDHKFLPESQWNHERKCLLWRRPNNSRNDSITKRNHLLSGSNMRTPDIELGSPVKSRELSQVIEHEDRVIKNNKKLLEKKRNKGSSRNSINYDSHFLNQTENDQLISKIFKSDNKHNNDITQIHEEEDSFSYGDLDSRLEINQ